MDKYKTMNGVTRLLFITAITLSTIAAYYSIVGLAAIFSSAFWAVVIMASVLEISKLVTASWLYHNWNNVNVAIKSYLTAAVVVLMMITSLGIFGFLSRAHVTQGLENTNVTLQIQQLDQELGQRREQVSNLQTQLSQLDRSINIQLDNNRATSALNARRQQEAERNRIRERLDEENRTILELTQRKTNLRQQESVLSSEVGPIRYVAEFFTQGEPNVEAAVRWMIVALVLVFDPLAVLMLIAANMSLKRNKPEPVPVVVDTTQIIDAVNATVANQLQQLKFPEPVPLELPDIAALVEESVKKHTPRHEPTTIELPDIAALVEAAVKKHTPKHEPAPKGLSKNEVKQCIDEALSERLGPQIDLGDIKNIVEQTVKDAVSSSKPSSKAREDILHKGI